MRTGSKPSLIAGLALGASYGYAGENAPQSQDARIDKLTAMQVT